MEFEDFSYNNLDNQQNALENSIECKLMNDECCLSNHEIDVEENKFDNQQQDIQYETCSNNSLTLSQNKRKIKKTSLLKKEFNFVSFISPLLEESQDNFILFGEIFCYFKSFLKYCKIGESNAPEYCYLTDFRPVLSTQIKNNVIYAQLDCSDGGQQIKEIRNKEIAQNNFQKIDYITKKLRTISDQNAYQFTNHLQNYKALIQQYAEMLDKVHSIYNYDYQALQEKLNENFIYSMSKTNEIIERIQQENPNAILQFFIKKLDAYTLTSKTNVTGGNNNFIELISGTSNEDLVSYYFTKFGTPEVLDWKGIVEITMAQFNGNKQFHFDLQTIDGYSIPAKAKYNFILLNSIEIIPGFSISDVLETYVYEINPQILKCIKTKRSLTVQKNIREDISYTIKSEIFIQKFYPEQSQTNKQKQNENIEKNKLPKNLDLKNMDSFSSILDPFLHQQEIQSELFRINRQVNSKYQ